MTNNDLSRQLRLIEASKKIATIYARYGQLEAAKRELSTLGQALQSKGTSRRSM